MFSISCNTNNNDKHLTKESIKIVIAHRGASGYLPEHTLEAKAMAYAMGA
ncbi:MAG: glycerophosphodiester phosphodiesterase, partial [Bacteroidetes bacterium]